MGTKFPTHIPSVIDEKDARRFLKLSSREADPGPPAPAPAGTDIACAALWCGAQLRTHGEGGWAVVGVADGPEYWPRLHHPMTVCPISSAACVRRCGPRAQVHRGLVLALRRVPVCSGGGVCVCVVCNAPPLPPPPSHRKGCGGSKPEATAPGPGAPSQSSTTTKAPPAPPAPLPSPVPAPEPQAQHQQSPPPASGKWGCRWLGWGPRAPSRGCPLLAAP
jgi:hypothetical protein